MENILIHLPAPWRDQSAIACVVSNTKERNVRDRYIREALDKIRENTSAKMAFVICRSLDEKEWPYWATVFCIF